MSCFEFYLRSIFAVYKLAGSLLLQYLAACLKKGYLTDYLQFFLLRMHLSLTNEGFIATLKANHGSFVL